MTGIAEFPSPSLAAQLAELKRERQMRARVYPNLVSSKKLSQKEDDYRNGCLDGAIRTIERLVLEMARVYPNLVSSKKLSQKEDDYRNGYLDGAIRTIERLVLEMKP